MFEIFKAIVLGFVQGATEFIPVSSSGHLVLVPWLLGWTPSSLLFDTVLHWGTLLAILIVFWSDFWGMAVAALQSLARRSLADPRARLAWAIVLGSVPAAIGGLFFEDFLEGLFASPRAAGFFLLVTAALLAGSEWLTARQQSRQLAGDAPIDSLETPSLDRLTFADAGVIGLAQALALAPGVSRSGSTIAAGLVRGLRRDDAARFSFLLGTPAFFGAGLLQLTEALSINASEVVAQTPALVVGFLVSAITGFAAIRFLLRYLRNHNLYIFAAYCLVAGLLAVGLTLIP